MSAGVRHEDQDRHRLHAAGGAHFFGLPHIEPMQDALLGKMQERLTE